MRHFALLTLGLVAFSTAPALAGSLNYADGHGAWQSARCTMPRPPAALDRNPEAAANTLNEQITAHNAFAAAAQQYMDCLSQEAGADAQAASQLITQSAQRMIQQVQSQVNTSSAQLSERAAKAGE